MSGYDQPLVILGQQGCRSSILNFNASPIAILSLRLVGIPQEGDVGYTAYLHILPYYPNALFVGLEFSLSDSEGVEEYHAQIDHAVQRLQKYGQSFGYVDLQILITPRYDRFLVFITTHSTPDKGMLWFGHEHAAVPANEVAIAFVSHGRTLT